MQTPSLLIATTDGLGTIESCLQHSTTEQVENFLRAAVNVARERQLDVDSFTQPKTLDWTSATPKEVLSDIDKIAGEVDGRFGDEEIDKGDVERTVTLRFLRSCDDALRHEVIDRQLRDQLDEGTARDLLLAVARIWDVHGREVIRIDSNSDELLEPEAELGNLTDDQLENLRAAVAEELSERGEYEGDEPSDEFFELATREDESGRTVVAEPCYSAAELRVVATQTLVRLATSADDDKVAMDAALVLNRSSDKYATDDLIPSDEE